MYKSIGILRGDQMKYSWLCVLSDQLLYAGGDSSIIDCWNYVEQALVDQIELEGIEKTYDAVFYAPKQYLIIAGDVSQSLFLDLKTNTIVGHGLSHPRKRVRKVKIIQEHILLSADNAGAVKFTDIQTAKKARNQFKVKEELAYLDTIDAYWAVGGGFGFHLFDQHSEELIQFSKARGINDFKKAAMSKAHNALWLIYKTKFISFDLAQLLATPPFILNILESKNKQGISELELFQQIGQIYDNSFVPHDLLYDEKVDKLLLSGRNEIITLNPRTRIDLQRILVFSQENSKGGKLSQLLLYYCPYPSANFFAVDAYTYKKSAIHIYNHA